jgi:hypothetical protein
VADSLKKIKQRFKNSSCNCSMRKEIMVFYYTVIVKSRALMWKRSLRPSWDIQINLRELWI